MIGLPQATWCTLRVLGCWCEQFKDGQAAKQRVKVHLAVHKTHNNLPEQRGQPSHSWCANVTWRACTAERV
jgi:hypothetical protein